mmetsp:Transcript_38906/g.90993  ORF Transcript_38906/g.90993 Transcript_38906/m.90993 type:complete len:248 (-) Transcript_38906:236-979(-)
MSAGASDGCARARGTSASFHAAPSECRRGSRAAADTSGISSPVFCPPAANLSAFEFASEALPFGSKSSSASATSSASCSFRKMSSSRAEKLPRHNTKSKHRACPPSSAPCAELSARAWPAPLPPPVRAPFRAVGAASAPPSTDAVAAAAARSESPLRPPPPLPPPPPLLTSADRSCFKPCPHEEPYGRTSTLLASHRISTGALRSTFSSTSTSADACCAPSSAAAAPYIHRTVRSRCSTHESGVRSA